MMRNKKLRRAVRRLRARVIELTALTAILTLGALAMVMIGGDMESVGLSTFVAVKIGGMAVGALAIGAGWLAGEIGMLPRTQRIMQRIGSGL